MDASGAPSWTGRHAVLIATRDPRNIADHGRMSVLRTCLRALESSFERVDVFFSGPSARQAGKCPARTAFVALRPAAIDRLLSVAGHLWRSPRSLNMAAGITSGQVAQISSFLDQRGSWPDLFVLDGVRSVGFLSSTRGAAVHVDLDDLLSRRYQAWTSLPFAELPFDLRGTRPENPLNIVARRLRRVVPVVLHHEARATAAVEKRVCAEADVVSLVSRSEAALLASTAGIEVLDLPMAVRLPRWKWSPPRDPRYDAVFLGRPTYLPNLAGLWWLGTEVMPAFHRLAGRAPRVAVVGAVTPNVADWLRQLGFEPLGFVEHLADVFGHAAAGVAPQTVHGGINTKVLDYAAHGLPVVGTPPAFAGLVPLPEPPWIEAADGERFARHLWALSEAPECAARLGGAGRAYVVRRYAETEVTERWASTFRTALARRTAHRLASVP